MSDEPTASKPRPGWPRSGAAATAATAATGVSPNDLGWVVERLADPIALTGAPAPTGGLPITYANAAFSRVTGCAEEDLLGAPLDRFVPAPDHGDLAAALAGATRDRITVSVGALPRRAFELTAYALGGAPGAPEAPGYVVLLRDVTDLAKERRSSERDRKRLAKLVDERTAKMEEFHERLRLTERLASIGTLGAGLCHDMNNLLMPIRAHLDAIEAAGLGGEQHEHLWSVREAIDYLQQLTNGLRLFALNPDDPEAGTGVADIPGWWRQLRPLLARTIPERITFEVDLDDDLPPVAIALHRLTQAVLNLLLNAVDAVDGRGAITLRARSTDDGRFVRLSVTDSGCGMTREAQQHALDPFFTTKPRGQSTGLGLSLVHGVVHGAGGRVGIESKVGAGTTVTLHLAAVSPADAADDAHDADGTASGVAVVTIEDQRIAACFTAFLRSAGFEVDAEAREVSAGRRCG